MEEHLRNIEKKALKLQKKAPPVREKIREFVESESGVNFGSDLHIGFSLDMDHIGFDVWYQTDKELEKARSTGFDRKLVKIMETAALTFSNAKSRVGFHSHQFVKEKCGGDYFQYLR